MARHKQTSGFSLVELLIAMLVAMFIAAALCAVFTGPSRSHAQRQEIASCEESLRKLHVDLLLYANEHGGAFPATVRLGETPPDYSCLAGLGKGGAASLIASGVEVETEPSLRGMKVFADSEGARGRNHGARLLIPGK
jgi:Prokaryotic N-terminal methylation motif